MPRRRLLALVLLVAAVALWQAAARLQFARVAFGAAGSAGAVAKAWTSLQRAAITAAASGKPALMSIGRAPCSG